MTSEATVPEAAVEAAWDAYQFHLPIHLRGNDFPAPMRTVLRAALTAALPHLSTAIHDAALEEAAKWHDRQAAVAKVIDPDDHLDRTQTGSNYVVHVASATAIRALKGKSIPAPAEGNEAEAAAPKPDPAIAELKRYDLTVGFIGGQEVASMADRPDGPWTPHADAIAALTASNDRVAELERERDALERLRPFWAQGWSADSVAAQAASAALGELWAILGASNQTEASSALKALTQRAEAAEAEVSRLKAGAVTDWQLIESVPKDGRSIAVWLPATATEQPHAFAPVSICEDGTWWDDSTGDQIEPLAATYWAPIHAPSRPLQSSRGEQMTLDELIERVEKATGPDREIDIDLCLLTEENSEAEYRRYCRMVPKGSPTVRQFITDRLCFRYTSSLDAIVGLIEAKLPGAAYTLNSFDVRRKPDRVRCNRVHLSDYPGTDHGMLGEGSTPALALCAAFLKALRALQQKEAV